MAKRKRRQRIARPMREEKPRITPSAPGTPNAPPKSKDKIMASERTKTARRARAQMKAPNTTIRPQEKENNILFLLGAGPCLKEFDFNILKDKNFMVFNRMFLSYDDFPKKPNYHCFIDQTTIKANKEKILELIIKNKKTFYFIRDINNFNLNNKVFFGKHKNLIYLKTTTNKKQIKFNLGLLDRQNLANPNNFKIFNNLDYFGDAGAFGLQLSYHLGFKQVNLAGIDSDFSLNKKRKEIVVSKEQRSVRSDSPDFAHYREDYYGSGTEYTRDYSNKSYIWKSIEKQLSKTRNIEFRVKNICKSSKLNAFKQSKGVR